MGWVSVRQAEQDQCVDSRPWEPRFAAITERELLLFARAPWTRDDWARPRTALPIAMTRLVRYRLSPPEAPPSAPITFTTRTGTQRGVASVQWRVGTPRELASWSRTVVLAAQAAVAQVDEIVFECRWRNCPVLLSMQHENGLTLRSAPGLARGKVLWHYSFDKLTDTWDDDRATVRLTFGDREIMELDMGASPKPFVFALHTCLSSKVERLATS
ncbi:beta-2-syntrophin-like [Pollicipes pollicipes]|nr:beta-2-syntrophin-like [Pollicipes pollicipes]